MVTKLDKYQRNMLKYIKPLNYRDVAQLGRARALGA